MGSPTPGTTAPAPADPTTEPADDPTETTAPGEALLDGTRQVDVQTYGARWVTTSVEGGITTVADPAESDVPTTWVIEPASDGGHLMRSTATVDGRDLCLNAPGNDVLGLETCDATSPSQLLDVGSLDQPEQVSIVTADGYLVADPDGGLALASDASGPGTVFVLVDRGPA
ncbi:hypothetical protein ACFS33_19180 [Cellulomonas phragmiteti]|uniref:hypothetical protein n=1 Tax=Cellulomonas phragmiteti TaxID=478780 RepID=UPI00363CDA5B